MGATFLASCPDRPGITAAITSRFYRLSANLIDLVQHVDSSDATFFIRIEFLLPGHNDPLEQRASLMRELGALADEYSLTWRCYWGDEVLKVAIMVSKQDHCLYDLLARWKAGELPIDIPVILSNHPHLERVATIFGIPFQLFHVAKDTKIEVEAEQIKLLKQHRVDLIVLAKYMQVLSPTFVETFKHKIINIHHSFLPAFVGAKPYHAAHARGVKLIGATSHYVTSELDAGPIIEQDLIRITHKDEIADMVRKGKDVEKLVLSRAVRLHVMRRVWVCGNKTVVF